MSETPEPQAPQPSPEQDPTKVFYEVPLPLLQGIVNYLEQQPFKEVANVLGALQKCNKVVKE